MRSFQSRLNAKMNMISQKLNDNDIGLAGVTTDVIRIRVDVNQMSDPTKINVDDIDVISMIFPALTDIPMRRFEGSTQTFLSANDATEEQTFECYTNVHNILDEGSIILKFFDNPVGSMPWVLPLQVKNRLGTFGSRKIVWMKLVLSYYDSPLDPKIYQWCEQLAVRRQILQW
jgi:hypothetical protein